MTQPELKQKAIQRKARKLLALAGQSWLIPALALGMALSGCKNVSLRKSTSSLVVTTAPTNTSDTYTLSTVTLFSTTSGTVTTQKMNLFINTQTAPQPISNWCEPYAGGAVSTKRCQCAFNWSESNSESGATVNRKVVTDITLVQANLVSCNVPGVYSTEIPNGTQIQVSIVPGPGNTGVFSSAKYTYTKSGTVDPGSFQDYQGRAFMNILRYSCYERRTRGMSIMSKMSEATYPTTGETLRFPLANRFCVQKVTSSGTSAVNSQVGCDGLPGADYTAQANFYNLYIRESEVGDINPSNSRFICPTVSESLGGSGSIGTGGQYWPLDSQFALSLGRTGDFPIGVVAHSRVSVSGDPVSSSSACDSGAASSGTSSGNSLTPTCLGFAAKPKSDGSCPLLTDSTGASVQTYRLRRYVTLYPQLFDTNGDFLREGQPIDTIYVVDRPVADPGNPSSFTLGYTMKGPKPCPFAYFDNKNVVSGGSGYVATNSTGWDGKNVDGIELPNIDSSNSCSALLPLVNSSRTVLSLTTIHSKNKLAKYQRMFIRPIKPWAPHYEEDTAFQACAPLANPFRDAPLHISKNPTTGNVSWCAEAYPTQNNNVAKLDTHTPTKTDPSLPYTGNVRPFTSHVSKNSISAACSATAVDIPTNASVVNYYPAGGKARHLASDFTDDNAPAINASQTCDRTVVNPNGGLSWPRFPLLAPAADVERALQNDSAYECSVSWDNKGAKSSGLLTPTQGCCGSSAQVWTGNGVAAPNNATGAHLEPGAGGVSTCSAPTY